MRQLYTVDSSGVIPFAGGINGPLSTPTVLPIDAVITMVRKGYVVYQHNPVNLSEKVLVTKDNVGKVGFKTNKAQGVTTRALNRSIQEMEKESKEKKEVIADVVRKNDNKQNNKKEDKKNKVDNKEEVKEETPSVFDTDFSKN